jgi:hypothetical protein
MAANYDNVNAVWPENAPSPSPQEALAAARKLVKLALTLGREGSPPKKFTGPFKLTSGNRYSWTRRGVFYVNPNHRDGHFTNGWDGLVHDISHWAGRRLYADYDPHDHRHAFIERTLAEHVVKSGWLDGKLKRPEKPKPPIDRTAVRAARVDRQIATWERKAKRAEVALKKLYRQQKYYAAKSPH